ncbi:SDR family NAD(P)-dependent oxidoreductase [Paenibacillus harenae]|uniref:Acyl transferase domain-containing protein/acyl carrier protein n=1 Tax=Paenibacillus harenae TaxID=306543 RepID=A0ABT9U988_PAEHA|nr:SDR family NAD(P)-dependent oxidoreductase [Paenibacillus harenae]MDQ0115571.1 acyl transferase domain-containing protein/acyl carrier protein [Paenibacillus harenae]
MAGREIREDIAIVGIACRFPDADNYHQYWENLEQGRNSIKEIPASRWDNGKYYSPNMDEPNKSISKWCGLLDDVDRFDHQFFQISPREAGNMDPQQRLLLEETWHCIEDAGVPLKQLQEKKTSVYVGVMAADYRQEAVKEGVVTDSYASLGSYECMLANRVSYAFNLQGPSLAINAACASSIVAIHEAKRSLLTGESDYAFAGGVSLNLHPWKYISFSKSRMLSPDGQCKTFDKDANGYVPGEGIGMVLMQRLEDALKQGSRIYGIVKGSAVNHVGKGVSVTAPSVKSQQEVILAAYRDAGISPETVSYAEAHGTGTSLGDPIEVESLSLAFREYTDKQHYCKIGSVKTNIGHLEAAAGVAGLIKVLMMLRHKKIPPTLNLKTVNPIIPFKRSPFEIADRLQDWEAPEAGLPLRASVSSFGFGGVNSHVLIEEFQALNRTVSQLETQEGQKDKGLFALSAVTPLALQKQIEDWKAFVGSNRFGQQRVLDISATLLNGRGDFPHRLGFVFSNLDELKQKLEQPLDIFSNKREQNPVLFIGEMKWSGYSEVEEMLKQSALLKKNLDQLLASADDENIVKGFKRKRWYASKAPLYRFAVGYALVRTLIELGFEPKGLAGEKSGLYIALAVCGIVKPTEVMSLLGEKNRERMLTASRPSIPFYDNVSNQMVQPHVFTENYLIALFDGLADAVTEETFTHYVHKARLLYNSQFTFKRHLEEWNKALQPFAGNVVEQLEAELPYEPSSRKQALLVAAIMYALRKLNQKWQLTEERILADNRFYELLDLIVDELLTKNEFTSLVLNGMDGASEIARSMNNKTAGKRIQQSYRLLRAHSPIPDGWKDLSNWLDQALEVNTALQDADEAFVLGEMGFQDTLLRLWLGGVPVHWQEIYPEQSYYKEELPIYSFDRESFWLPGIQKDEIVHEAAAAPSPINESLLKSIAAELIQNCARILQVDAMKIDPEGQMADYGLEPVHLIEWTEGLQERFGVDLSVDEMIASETFMEAARLLLRNLSDVPHRIHNESASGTAHLRRIMLTKVWEESPLQPIMEPAGPIIILANREQFHTAEVMLRNGIAVDCSLTTAEQGRDLARDLLTRYGLVTGLIDLSDLSSTATNSCQTSLGKFAFLQEIVKRVRKQEFRLLHLTAGLQTFQAKQTTMKGAATASLVKMLGAEYKKLQAKTVDIDSLDVECLRETVCREWLAPDLETECIYRSGLRYSPKMKEVSASVGPLPDIDANKVYIVTGGTRGIGAEVAKHLVSRGARKLLLMGVQPYPPKEQWNHLLQNPGTDSKLADRLRNVLDLEAQGAIVEWFTGSLSDSDILAAFLQSVRARLGAVGGVVHCAGLLSNENPAFISKTADEIQRVLEPKISGLAALNEALIDERPDFFILFSSVAGTIPMLAVGLSDYAAANGYMDYYAAYQRSQGRLWFQAIQWPNWKEVGMGDVTGKLYTEMGLTAHDTSDGLQMLDFAMTHKKDAAIMPAVVDADVFEPERLLYARPAKRETFMKMEENQSANIVPSLNESTKSKASSDETIEKLKEMFSNELLIPKEKLDGEASFGELGVDSILINVLTKKVEEWIGMKLDPSLFLEYPTLNQFADYLQPAAALEETDPPNPSQPPEASKQSGETSMRKASSKIAVIGVGCHFPGAENKDDYWRNLVNGTSSIVEVPDSRWDKRVLYSPTYEKGKSISKWGGFLDQIERFDPRYFGISEEDALHLDPLIRQFMEVTAQTLHDAGYEKHELSNKNVGVFVGSRVGNYGSRISDIRKSTITGIGQNFIGAHISHFFNWKGPNLVVDTACSSSLVSIHLACQSLLSGESEIALAGGVEILLDEQLYLILSEGMALSPDGRCHTFDEKANGFVPGEGAGAVLLKPLDKALQDGDRIYAVVEATAVNNDGTTMGITTPNLEAQSAMIHSALTKGEIDASSISYVETHGTGTMIGDPIEMKALTKVFRAFTEEKAFCGVGSAKTNIGHLLSAAGVASFIKVVLSLWNKQLPPTLNCDSPNPRLDFNLSPFYPNTTLRDWQPRAGIRRASISSFGFGGTNAHAILSESEPSMPGRAESRRASLPPIEFNRQRYWLDAKPGRAVAEPAAIHTSGFPKMLQFIEEEQF